MAKIQVQPIRTVDPIWARVREEAEAATKTSPELATFVFATVLNHDRLEDAIAYRVAARLDHPDLPASIIRQAYSELIEAEPSSLGAMMRADIVAVTDRDPAT